MKRQREDIMRPDLGIRFSPLLVAVILLATACGSSSRSTPSAPTPPPRPPTSALYHVSGTVTDEDGAPVPDANVVVYYPLSGDTTRTPGSLARDTSTTTDERGRYSLEFWADVVTPGSHVPYALAVLTAGQHFTEREHDVQLAETSGTTEIVKNLRLRRFRTIRVGETAVVSVHPDSALCFDYDTLFSLNTQCGWVRVTVNSGESVKAEASPTEPGGIVPRIIVESATSNSYRVGVEIPVGTAPQQYVVSTAPRPEVR